MWAITDIDPYSGFQASKFLKKIMTMEEINCIYSLKQADFGMDLLILFEESNILLKERPYLDENFIEIIFD